MTPTLTLTHPPILTWATAADLFAGWGGFTTGAQSAGVNVVWAANHWQLAVDTHQLNHPSTVHSCQDLNQANFYDLPDIDLLLASPACQGHSQASQPKRRRFHDQLRSTAWAVVSCADAKEPEVIIVENVPDFLKWRMYPAWKFALEALGYTVHCNVLTASHFGVPQRRKRLFITVTKSAAPLILTQPDVPEMAFGPCIDWDEGPWYPVAGKSIRVRERVANGRVRGLGDRFLTQHVTNHPGVGLDEPIRTITTKDQWAVVDGDMMRQLTVRENIRAMGFPASYQFPEHATRTEIIKGLGNAVPPEQVRQILEQVRLAA